MYILKAFQAVVVLFLASWLFCWLLTSNLSFNPILTLVTYVGGVTLLSVLGLLVIHHD